MGFDERPADRQAEAQARTSPGILRCTLDEGLEDLLQPRRLEAATFVLEFDREGIGRGSRLHPELFVQSVRITVYEPAGSDP